MKIICTIGLVMFSGAAFASPLGEVFLRGLGLEAYLDYPSLPDPKDMLIGEPPEPVLAPLGTPQGSTNIGTSQVVEYRNPVCLSRPDCRFIGGCRLSLTIIDNKITDARTEGIAPLQPYAHDYFANTITGICAGAYWSKLKGLAFTGH